MMLSISSYVRRGRCTLHELSLNPKFHALMGHGLHFAAGFCLSAASLGNFAQPLCLGLVCAATGPGAVLIALGSLCGYGLFWDSAGAQGLVWVLAGLITALALAFFSASVNDVFALFTGLSIGRHKLAPQLSPKKTIEGSIGGLVASTLFSMAVPALLRLHLYLPPDSQRCLWALRNLLLLSV